MRDEMIKHILKNYEETLMIEENNPNRHSILTHGQFHIQESIQYRRNQCKILEDENCREAYMCVHSEEFSTRNNFKLPKDNNNSLFFTEGWLIYRCDAMKTKNITAFNTIHGTMIGDSDHKKTLHWLGIHADHCTIRMIEHEISEMIGTKKEAERKPASNEEIEQEREKFKAIPMEFFIPTILPQSQYTTPTQSSTPPTPQQPVTYQQEFQSAQANVMIAPVNQSPIQQNVLPFQQQEQITQHASEEETNKAHESTNGFNWYEDTLDMESFLLNC